MEKWDQERWSQLRLNKAWFSRLLSEAGYRVLGWCNRQPTLIRPDGDKVDWADVQKIALGFWNDRPKEEEKPVVTKVKPLDNPPVEEPKPEPKPSPQPKRKRGRPKKKG